MTPEQTLIDLYDQAAERLRRRIRTALKSGNLGSARYRAEQLESVNRELRRLGARTGPAAGRAVLEPYVAGAYMVDRVSADRPPGRAGYAFSGGHPRALNQLALEATTRLDVARATIGRRVDDAYRAAALQEIGIGIAEGAARREVSAALQERLTRNRITDALTGFVDAGGRRWQLDVYTRMVARTTTREAMTAGTRNRMGEVGQDLVTISDHGTQCDICGPYEGETYSAAGATPGYEVLDEWPPFHPNCEHYAIPGSGDLDDDLDALEKEAEAGFDPALLAATARRLGI